MIEVSHGCAYSMEHTPFSYSPLVQEDILHLGQLCVYKDAAQTYRRFCSGNIDGSQIQRVVQYYSSEFGEIPDVELTGTPSDDTIDYTMVDGSMVLTDLGWKEVKVGRHFSNEAIVKTGMDDRREIVKSVYHAQMTDAATFIKVVA